MKQLINTIIFLLSFCVFYIIPINKAFADNTDPIINNQVLINEAYPNPNSSENEWIEIFNSSQEDINLNGWTLVDEVSSPSIVHKFSDEDKINPLSFFIVELSSSKLNNSGDTINLINDNQEIISQLSYVNSEPEKSFSLTKDGEIIISSPTKNKINEETDQTSNQKYPDLFIHNATACPKDDDPESIEIQNPNNTAVILNNWQIKDLANNKIVLTEKEIALELNLTTISLTKSILNNSGDTIFLLDPNDKLIDQFSYDDCDAEDSTPIAEGSVSNQEGDKTTGDSENKDQPEEEEKTSTKKTNPNDNLKKINHLLEIINYDKSSSENKEDYVSSQIVVKHKDLPKSAVISVIIGGAIISSSGLLFMKTPKLQ
jgi:hypothetical protein